MLNCFVAPPVKVRAAVLLTVKLLQEEVALMLGYALLACITTSSQSPGAAAGFVGPPGVVHQFAVLVHEVVAPLVLQYNVDAPVTVTVAIEELADEQPLVTTALYLVSHCCVPGERVAEVAPEIFTHVVPPSIESCH